MMRDSISDKELGPFTVSVHYDDYSESESPRDWCNLTTIRGWHRRMIVGDGPNIDSESYDGWDDMLSSIIAEHDAVMVAPLYWYEHSGATCRMGPAYMVGQPNKDHVVAQAEAMQRFRAECMDDAGWDSGVAGIVIVSRAAQSEQGTPDNLIADAARSEVETYAAWLEGRVYYWTISATSECDQGHEHVNVYESCGGYVGEDDFALDEGISAAEGIIDSMAKTLTRVLVKP
jgi:hypothetical protein